VAHTSSQASLENYDTWLFVWEREKLAGRSSGLSSGEHSYNKDKKT